MHRILDAEVTVEDVRAQTVSDTQACVPQNMLLFFYCMSLNIIGCSELRRLSAVVAE